jgi:hypothetical protein
MKKAFLVVALFASFTLFSCGNSKTDTTTKVPETTTTQPATATVMYECPMKDTPPSDKPGKCAKCGMDLKEVKK